MAVTVNFATLIAARPISSPCDTACSVGGACGNGSEFVRRENVDVVRKDSRLSHSGDAPSLSVRNVFKAFGRRPKEIVRRIKAGEDRADLTELGTAAVIDASFDVQPGEIFVVMGLSGSGKSTLILSLIHI